MQVEAAFIDQDQAFQTGHAGEHAGGDRSAGDGEPRVGVGAEQMVEQAGREHGVAEAGGGDEQDAHAGPCLAGLPAPRECPTSRA